ncbi:hypothetical protein Tco_1519444 [Tanacetum coccineum]
MCKVSVQSKRITLNSCEKNLQDLILRDTQTQTMLVVTWIEKVPQVLAKSLGGKLVCWSAKKQQTLAMSSAEAEYVATVGC